MTRIRTVDRRSVPAHGYLGQFAGKNQKEVRAHIKRTYQVLPEHKIVVNFIQKDQPFSVYEVEVLARKGCGCV